ncbi:Vacuolar-processing enzyme [Linum grandiflorum]
MTTTNLQQFITVLLTIFLTIFPSLSAAAEVLPRDGPPPSPARNNSAGTRWAILVAGSDSYVNYRHQADVCHAYHVLKRGGLEDDNIVVFMYDDVAFDDNNPRLGVLINNPAGEDVYAGVPKDYTGENCTADNLYAVILGNRSALTGGSGKVVNSGPYDTVFVYYADHGGPGIVAMPVGKGVNARELMDVLQMKHNANGYKSMVIYMEACDAGSMFDGVLPNDTNIYAVTASNPSENSYAFYCPNDYPNPSAPPDYDTCIGDLFSISWLEDCDLHDPRFETLDHQYQLVKRRTGNDDEKSSHVMQYGDITIAQQLISVFMGEGSNFSSFAVNLINYTTNLKAVSQRDIHLVHLEQRLKIAAEGSKEKAEAQEKLNKEVSNRKHADERMSRIGALVFGVENADGLMDFVRPFGQPLVDDWDCFKSFVEKYEGVCGKMTVYGRKYSRGLANMCNGGVTLQQLASACTSVCHNISA